MYSHWPVSSLRNSTESIRTETHSRVRRNTLATLTFDLLTLKVVSESCVMWATSVPILVFLGLSVLDLGPMYATGIRSTKNSSTKGTFFRRISLRTSFDLARSPNLADGAFLGVSHALNQGPNILQILGNSTYVHTVWRTATKMFLQVNHILIPRGGSGRPKRLYNFWVLHTYAHAVWPKATKLGTVTRGKWRLYRGSATPIPRGGTQHSQIFGTCLRPYNLT